MLVLIVALPSSLGLNLDMKPAELQKLTTELEHALQYFKAQVSEKKQPVNDQAKSALTEYNTPKGEFNEAVFSALIAELEDLRANFTGKTSIAQSTLGQVRSAPKRFLGSGDAEKTS